MAEGGGRPLAGQPSGGRTVQELLNEQMEERLDVREAVEDARTRLALLRRLIAARKVQGLTQEDVAERMGVGQSTVSGLESGTADSRFSTLQRYARAVDHKLCFSLDPIKTYVTDFPDRVTDAEVVVYSTDVYAIGAAMASLLKRGPSLTKLGKGIKVESGIKVDVLSVDLKNFTHVGVRPVHYFDTEPFGSFEWTKHIVGSRFFGHVAVHAVHHVEDEMDDNDDDTAYAV